MNANILWMLLGLVFGSIGLGFFMYGRRQTLLVMMISGICLMIVPMFLSNLVALVIVGSALTALPYFFEI